MIGGTYIIDGYAARFHKDHIHFTRSNNPLDFDGDAEEEQCFTTWKP
jgi:hypothetical protein